jgi:hypothetical protein
MFTMDKEVNLLTDSKHFNNNNVLEYLSRHTIRLNLPFILVENKILTIGGVYLKTENWLADSRTEPVRLIDFWEKDHFIYLKVQNIDNFEVIFLKWNLNATMDYWLWSIAAIDFLSNLRHRPSME